MLLKIDRDEPRRVGLLATDGGVPALVDYLAAALAAKHLPGRPRRRAPHVVPTDRVELDGAYPGLEGQPFRADGVALIRDRVVPGSLRASSVRALVALVRNRVGVTIAVDVVEPDGIERSQGKMRRIIDERGLRGT